WLSSPFQSYRMFARAVAPRASTPVIASWTTSTSDDGAKSAHVPDQHASRCPSRLPSFLILLLRQCSLDSPDRDGPRRDAFPRSNPEHQPRMTVSEWRAVRQSEAMTRILFYDCDDFHANDWTTFQEGHSLKGN